jgi:hypothetical protein
MVARAQALDGTCTGEHSVGMGKMEYLEAELGKGTVKLMETIKRTSTCSLLCPTGSRSFAYTCLVLAVDPNGIMNPVSFSSSSSLYPFLSAMYAKLTDALTYPSFNDAFRARSTPTSAPVHHQPNLIQRCSNPHIYVFRS